ncbi:MAG: hypothetical protein JXB05_31175 [Myxococcaceae bacterium]|nr:hypothetical protein [Myxococcaceae bacterium]
MDPGTKAAVIIGSGVFVLGGGWALFSWLVSVLEDPTASEGQEVEEPADQEGPPSSSSED